MEDNISSAFPAVSHPIPILRIEGLPDAEREPTRVISGLLREVGSCVDSFKAAVALFDHATPVPLGGKMDATVSEEYPEHARRWRFMAAKEAAMQIYYFGEIVRTLRGSFRLAPELRRIVKHNALREAEKDFKEQFPRYEWLRHAVAHEAELTKEPIYILTHKPGTAVMITGAIQGRTFVTKWEKEQVTCDVSLETWATLFEIARIIYSAFDNAETHLKEISGA